jgi:hypothetical protein
VRRAISRKTVIAAVLCAAFVSMSVVSPAVGGPSISKVSRIAKKALKTGRTANKRAKTALRGPRVVEVSQEDIAAAPNDFAEFDVRCPRRYTAVGIGLGLGALEPVFFASYGGGALGAMFNPSTTTVFTGNAYVECVKSAGYVSSARVFRSKGEASKALRSAERAKAARLREERGP